MKLFWLDIPRAREENCFVLARTSSQAAKYEEDGTGHGRGDVIAHEIMTLDAKMQVAVRNVLLNDQQKSEASSKSKKWWPAYAWDDCLKLLGLENKIVNGRDCYCLDGRVFQIERFEWSILNKRPKVIRQVSDLLKFVKSLNGEEWVFRGQRDALWPARSGVWRIYDQQIHGLPENFEKKLLNEFKQKSPPFLTKIPENDWEWLILAQHAGLPTRLLDWTTNPLIALFFSVDHNLGDRDGVVIAYSHRGVPVHVVEHIGSPWNEREIQMIYPPHLYDRVAIQSSVLTAEPNLDDPTDPPGRAIETWHVSSDCVDTIQKELEMLGVSEERLFPRLEAICRSIRRKAVGTS